MIDANVHAEVMKVMADEMEFGHCRSHKTIDVYGKATCCRRAKLR